MGTTDIGEFLEVVAERAAGLNEARTGVREEGTDYRGGKDEHHSIV